ncbi:rab11 family-interacting protein 1-like [Eublepharis macularius]|uniref:Rab11 family-interacting protein 1-like n=1 Tax=Eublepharis macularius TaxID=481883 RepID=A0AA97JVY4_EUBMA|nr:rab11 family-interacting protein 1-like [Eublepharis macularius]
MFDLSVKEKPRSPFGKLKDKVKGRRQYDLESASAIIPSSSGALEEDFGLGGKKAKGGSGFFFKNKLRKSSLTQSSTSLGSDSTVSSASSVVGLSASEVGAAPSPSRHSSLPANRSVRDFLPSPKLTHKRAFSDEASQINLLPESKSAQSLKPQGEPVSRSSLCINGSHIYCEEPSPKPAVCPAAAAAHQSRPKKPAESFSTGPPAPESVPPLWSSSSFQRPPQKDPPRFIPSPPILAAQEEDKLSVKTLALSKRSRAKMDEGVHAEGKPVQVAMPMVFSAKAGRGRPPEEAQEDEKRTQAGFCQDSSKDDAGKSCTVESAGHVVAGGRPEGEKSNSWFSMKDGQDPSQRPSSQAGLLATAGVAKDTCVSEDHGPSSFLRAGPLQPESAPQSVSAFEPVAAASPPLEWGDPFDAFATSRLRPEAQREPLPHRNAAWGGLTDGDPSEDAGLPEISAGLPLRWPSEPGGSPGTAPEETLVGGGSPPPPPQGAGLPVGAPEEDASVGVSRSWREPTLVAVEAKAADSWREAPRASPAESSSTFSGSQLPLGQASESDAVLCGSSEKSPLSTPREGKLDRPAVLPLGACITAEAERQEDALASMHKWGSARQEQTVLQLSPTPSKARLLEEADSPHLMPGCSADEGRGVPWESGEQRGGQGRQGIEAAPPKPPRRFTPLSLEGEANEAVWGVQVSWQAGAEGCEDQAGPVGVEVPCQGPPGNDGSAPRAAAAVIGAGGKSLGCGPEGLLLPAADEGPARANELTGQASPLGDSVLAISEGAGGAEQLGTCPGKPGQSAVGGEPGSVLSPGLSTLQVPRPLPVAEEGPRPSGRPQELEPRPSVLFWTALEDQLLTSSWNRASLKQQHPGLGEDTSDMGSSLGQGDGAALALPEVDRTGSPGKQAPPAASAYPQVLASGTLKQGHRGSSVSDSELSSSWSDDRVIDFKKADFWQVEKEEESSRRDAVGVPGNPFVSRTSPQNNPFVERPPDVLPALQVCPAEGVSCRDLHAGDALPGLLPANPSRGQPVAPFLHDSQPLAFSTPSLEAASSSCTFDFPSPIVPPASSGGSAAGNLLAACLPLALPSPSTDASAPSVLPVESQPADEVPVQQTTSPHPVKPISTARQVEKQRRSSLPLSQEKLKPKSTSSDDSVPPALKLDKTDLKRDPSLPDCSAKYYHLTHDELIQLVLKREAELSRKQEHIRELENYIDRLLVRIMEQSPTLLQIPLGGGAKAAK